MRADALPASAACCNVCCSQLIKRKMRTNNLMRVWTKMTWSSLYCSIIYKCCGKLKNVVRHKFWIQDRLDTTRISKCIRKQDMQWNITLRLHEAQRDCSDDTPCNIVILYRVTTVRLWIMGITEQCYILYETMIYKATANVHHTKLWNIKNCNKLIIGKRMEVACNWEQGAIESKVQLSKVQLRARCNWE